MLTQASLHNAFARIHNVEAVLNELLEAVAANGAIRPEQVPLAIEVFGQATDAATEDEAGTSVATPAGPAVAGPDDEQRPPMDPDVAEEWASTSAIRWPGVVLRSDAPEKKVAQEVDCAARMHICHAVCCSLQFPLSAEEVEAGRVKWDLGHPYMIRDNTDGYCCHNDPAGGGCTVYEDRPAVCRHYSCASDERIWTDFEGMVLNTEWLSEHLGSTGRRRMQVSLLPKAGEGR